MNHLSELTDEIRQALVTHFEDMHVIPFVYSRFEWLTKPLDDPNNLHRMYGWLPPKEVPPEEGPEFAGSHVIVIAPFCPEIIAEQTLHLTAEEHAFYMDTIFVSTALHLAHRDKPLEERERIIEEYMWTEGEDSMRLMNAVQMRALDIIRGEEPQ